MFLVQIKTLKFALLTFTGGGCGGKDINNKLSIHLKQSSRARGETKLIAHGDP